MTTNGDNLIADLRARGLIAQMTAEPELLRHLGGGCRSIYCGFDPTAESLHIGNLVPLLTLRRFQLAGHRPIALVGGATGLIGDPSGKSEERNLSTVDDVAERAKNIKDQVSRFLDFDAGESSAEVVNNLDWMGNMDMLSFLRDVGKHFSVNAMIQKESVKQRLDREGAGISYTEFSYMILQSYDFAELNKRYNCTLQLGGSDQWGNITGGIDLTRRLNAEQVFGVTVPLVTKADGTKFGKTESGTVWLDSKKTSPYAFYQFWINAADADMEKFLNFFSFQWSAQGIKDFFSAGIDYMTSKVAKQQLAKEMTQLVHGTNALLAAERISDILFDGVVDELSESDFDQLALDGLPSTLLNEEQLNKPITALLSEAGMGNGKQVKDALGRNAVLVNDMFLGMEDNMDTKKVFGIERSKFGRYFLVKLGKKKHHLFELV